MPAKTRSQLDPAVKSKRLASLRELRQTILAHLAEEGLTELLGSNPLGAEDDPAPKMRAAALATRLRIYAKGGRDYMETGSALSTFANACVLATRQGEGTDRSFLTACVNSRNWTQQRQHRAEWAQQHGQPEPTARDGLVEAEAPLPSPAPTRKPLEATDPTKGYQIRDGAKGRWLSRKGGGPLRFGRVHQTGSYEVSGGPELDAWLAKNPTAVPHPARDYKNGSARYRSKQ